MDLLKAMVVLLNYVPLTKKDYNIIKEIIENTIETLKENG